MPALTTRRRGHIPPGPYFSLLCGLWRPCFPCRNLGRWGRNDGPGSIVLDQTQHLVLMRKIRTILAACQYADMIILLSSLAHTFHIVILFLSCQIALVAKNFATNPDTISSVANIGVNLVYVG
jgi:hypothetical protein